MFDHIDESVHIGSLVCESQTLDYSGGARDVGVDRETDNSSEEMQRVE